MPYVAMIFNPVPELPEGLPHQPPASARMQARYLSGLYDLDPLGWSCASRRVKSAWTRRRFGSA